MFRRHSVTRRSFVTRVTGGVVAAGSPLAAIVEKTHALHQPDTDRFDSNPASLFADSSDRQARQPQQPQQPRSGCSDSDPTDPGGNGRNCTPAGPYRGCSDRDPTDPGGHGRHCTATTNTPCTDRDPVDPAGRGRGCGGGQPQPPPPPPPPPDSGYRGNTTYTGCSDTDSGSYYDRSGYGRNCQQRTGGNQTYTGCSDADAGQNFDRAGYGRNCSGQQPAASSLQAWFDPECNPITIHQSRLPSTTCSLNIRGFRRNTADPVEVLLPQAIDGFGNHANGIQITFSGQGNTYDWPDVYRWSLFIFACPALPGTGANCYNAGTRISSPVSFSVPIIVRQRGAGEARVTLSGTIMPHPGANNPLSSPAAWYTFQNLWRPEFLLNYANDTRWLVQPVLEQPGYVRLHAAANSTYAIHVENGSIFVGPYQPYWDSALWALETPRGPGLVRIRNKWRSDWYIHVERGVVEAGPAQPFWDSSFWRMQPANPP